MKTKEQKRSEADERKEQYRLREPEEQIELLKQRPGNSKRELTKLRQL